MKTKHDSKSFKLTPLAAALGSLCLLTVNPVSADETEVEVTSAKPKVEVIQDAPKVSVEQKKARVMVDTNKPEVNIESAEPEVDVQQPDPEVTIKQAEPKVRIETAEPRVVINQEEPEVNIEQAEPNVEFMTEQELREQRLSSHNEHNRYQKNRDSKNTNKISDVNLGKMKLDELDDMSVVMANGKELGEVDEVVQNRITKEIGFVVSIGGILGVGDTEVFVPASQSKIMSNKIVWDTSKSIEQLEDSERYVEESYIELSERYENLEEASRSLASH